MTFMGENPSSFYNGMQNYNTQSTPWVSNHFSHGILDMSSNFPSSTSPPYGNTSFGSRTMMPPSYPSPFGGSHIIQTPLMVGGWNLPSYESTMREVSAQPRNHSTFYTQPTYPSFAMSVPTNTFPWRTFICPLVFHMGGKFFIVWETPSRSSFVWGKHISSHE
jgi:hypothetical protein